MRRRRGSGGTTRERDDDDDDDDDEARPLLKDRGALVVHADTPLPPGCIVCGAPPDAASELSEVEWTPAGWIALVVLVPGLFGLPLLLGWLQRRLPIRLSLCRLHGARNRNLRRLAVGLMLVAVGCLAGALYAASEVGGTIGGVAYLGAIVASQLGVPRIRRVERGWVFLQDAAPQLLKQAKERSGSPLG